MLRKTFAIILGIIIGSVVNLALIELSNSMYPLPPEIDSNDFEAFKAHLEKHGMPIGALLLVLMAHAGGSLASGFACGAIAKKAWYRAAAVLGLLWTAGGITMLLILPAPTWFVVTDLALYIPAALLGALLGGKLTGNGESFAPAD